MCGDALQDDKLRFGRDTVSPIPDRECLSREVANTMIRFGRPSNKELHAYAATGDGLNFAGAFSIEGRGGPFVEGIDGSPSNVLGLSLPHFRSMVSQLGVQIFDLWRDG